MQSLENRIIEVFSSSHEKYGYKQISAKLHIYDKEGRNEVVRTIEKFVNVKILLKVGRGKYRINPRYLSKETTGRNYATGRLEVKYGGAAFVLQEGDNEDIFIPERKLSNALHGDLVKVLVYPPREGRRPEGEIVVTQQPTAFDD